MRTAMQSKIALTILSFALAGTISAQNRAADFQVTKVTRNLIATPEYNYSGAGTFHASTRDRWLEVEVEFLAAPAFTEEPINRWSPLVEKAPSLRAARSPAGVGMPVLSAPP
jgi:hypothetical protein